MKVTPESHPHLYRPIDVGPRKFFVRYLTEGYTVGVREAVYEAYRQAFMEATNTTQFDADAYDKWVVTKEGERKTDIAAMRILLIPTPGEEPFCDDDLEWLTEANLKRAKGFFEKESDSRTNELPTSTDSSSSAVDSKLTA